MSWASDTLVTLSRDSSWDGVFYSNVSFPIKPQTLHVYLDGCQVFLESPNEKYSGLEDKIHSCISLYSQGKYKMFRKHNPQDNYVRFSGRKKDTCEMWKVQNTLAKKLSKGRRI